MMPGSQWPGFSARASVTHVCSLAPPLPHASPSRSLTPSHPPVCWAKHSQLYLLCDRRPWKPGLAAGADLLCCHGSASFWSPRALVTSGVVRRGGGSRLLPGATFGLCPQQWPRSPDEVGEEGGRVQPLLGQWGCLWEEWNGWGPRNGAEAGDQARWSLWSLPEIRSQAKAGLRSLQARPGVESGLCQALGD